MWRTSSRFLVAIAVAASAAHAQVPPPDAKPAAPAQPTTDNVIIPGPTAPSVTIPLTPQPGPADAPPPTEPAKSELPIKVETAPSTEALGASSAAAPVPKPKLPKAKSKPKLAPVAPKDIDTADVPFAKGEISSGKPPSFRCFVRDVMAFYDRTHVRCYNKARGKIIFFAVDTGQPIASTVLSKALNGIQLGKPVTLSFAPGADLNPSNCDATNCRRLLDIKN